MNKELLKFHMSCKKEFTTLSNNFNLLFYGYGNKEKILKALFPKAKKFNMHFSSLKSIVEDLLLDGFGDNANSTIKDIDEWLESKNKILQLILFNFDFEIKEFSNLKNIKIIATVENINFKFELEDLEEFNFIFRDLTTFEDYEDEIIDIELTENKVQNVIMVYNNLSFKSKAVFKALLKLGNCTITNLFDNIKKELFITTQTSLVELLKEFVDHKIIKIQENMVVLFLSKTDMKTVLESIE